MSEDWRERKEKKIEDFKEREEDRWIERKKRLKTSKREKKTENFTEKKEDYRLQRETTKSSFWQTEERNMKRRIYSLNNI